LSRSKPRKINGLFVLVATVGIVFGSAAPAAAAYTVTGSGLNGLGYELGPNYRALCSDNNNQFTGAWFETTYYLITHSSSTYLVYDNGTPVAYYTGPASMNIQHEDMIAGPQGAMPTDDLGTHCSGTVFTADEVPLTRARVSGSATNGGVLGSVSCDVTQANGTYLRVLNDVDFDFNVSCTVKGNTSSLNQTRVGVPIKHHMDGVQVICGYIVGGCAHPDAGSQLTTTFSIQAS